jgi:uncharacterized metal-binding protein
MQFKQTIFTFTMLLSASIGFAQSNFYVSPTGNNANNGSLAAPWKKVQYGLDQLAAGDTLNVLTGVYAEKVQLPISGITLRNHRLNSPVLDATGITGQVSIIEIYNVSNITVQGFEVKNNIMLDAQGILVEGNCQNITIKNCKVHDIHFSANAAAPATSSTNAQGIIVYGSAATAITNLKIQNNEVYNCRLGYSEGVAINGNVDGFEVSGNSVHDLTNIGIDLAGHEGVCSNPLLDQARNGIVKRNTVHHCLSPYATSGGLYVDGGKNIVIEQNTSYHNGYGVEIGCENVGKTTSGIVVKNNIVYDNQVCGIALGGYDFPANSGKVIGSTIRNNTCYANDFNTQGYGELYLSYSEGSIVENNIFYTSAQNILAYAEFSQSGLVFNHNVFYNAAGAQSGLMSNWNGTFYGSLTALKTATNSNANSVFGNPNFTTTNITAPNFHLTSTSSAINKGNPTTVLASGETDIDGQNRKNATIDYGADEYFAPVNTENQVGYSVSKPNALAVFPNPAQQAVTISNKNSTIEFVILYNAMGYEMARFKLSEASDTSIDVSAFAKGVYFLVGFDKNKRTNSSKLVIE